MIQSLIRPRVDFDLNGFIDSYARFYSEWSDKPGLAYFITGIKKYGDTPENFLAEGVKDENLAILQAITTDSLKVFFMMHEPAANDWFLCIDGKKRRSEDLDISEMGGYGFLIETDGDKIVVHPALYDGASGTAQSLMLQGICSILEEPMTGFVKRFCNEQSRTATGLAFDTPLTRRSIDDALVAEAEQALERYIQRQRKKGATVVIERPLYHEGLSNLRCVLCIDGQSTRVWFRQQVGRWIKAAPMS